MTPSPWIPCSERLPDLDTEVLVAYAGGKDVWFAERREDCTASLHGEPLPDPKPWWWSVACKIGWSKPERFTHWQPLPEPPR